MNEDCNFSIVTKPQALHLTTWICSFFFPPPIDASISCAIPSANDSPRSQEMRSKSLFFVCVFVSRFTVNRSSFFIHEFHQLVCLLFFFLRVLITFSVPHSAAVTTLYTINGRGLCVCAWGGCVDYGRWE